LHTPCGSVAPAAIGEQVPIRPGSAHETQAPWHATLQHTPSEQKPLVHSAFAMQDDPGRGEQKPSWQLALVHSASVAQVCRQWAAASSQV